MAPKRYQIVLLFALLLQWAAAPWLPACCAAPAGHRPAPQDVFPRYVEKDEAAAAGGRPLAG